MNRRVIATLFFTIWAGVVHAATYPLGNYGYDGSGNVVTISSGSDQHLYQYDAFGRVKRGSLSANQWQEYDYDRYGNISAIRTAGAATERRLGVDPNTNQIDLPVDPVTGATRNVIGTYDASGNMTSFGAIAAYRYDGIGVVTDATVSQVEKVHIYNAADERIATITTSSGEQAWAIRGSGGQVLRRFKRTSAGTLQWEEDYVYRDWKMLAAFVSEGDVVRHFHLDHLGTPRLTTNGTGAKGAEHVYYPFGEEVPSQLQDQEKNQFTGHERDRDSGGPAGDLDSMHARYYAVSAGRFLSVDPGNSWDAADPQSWNLYTYVKNNPLRRIDPDGREDKETMRALRISDVLRNGEFRDRYMIDEVTVGLDLDVSIQKTKLGGGITLTQDLVHGETFTDANINIGDLKADAHVSSKSGGGYELKSPWGDKKGGAEKPKELGRIGFGILSLRGNKEDFAIGISVGLPGMGERTVGIKLKPLLQQIKAEPTPPPQKKPREWDYCGYCSTQ